MMEIFLHTIGICGDPHPKLLELAPILSYIYESKTAFAYTLRNTWQYLNIF